MALSKDKKKEVVHEVGELISGSRMIVMARYQGTAVNSMQELRRLGKQDNIAIRVIKNRLFKQALKTNKSFSDTDTGMLAGEIIYAFGDDEIAPAKLLNDFAKVHPQFEFVGGLDWEGKVFDAGSVKELAKLPTKEQLRAQLVGTLSAPSSSFVRTVSANITGLLRVLSSRAEKI